MLCLSFACCLTVFGGSLLANVTSESCLEEYREGGKGRQNEREREIKEGGEGEVKGKGQKERKEK
jgi:hypothetical protein